MSIGQSGRIVLEVSPDLKRELYSSLASEGLTLKGWFIHQVNDFLQNRRQLNLELSLVERETSDIER